MHGFAFAESCDEAVGMRAESRSAVCHRQFALVERQVPEDDAQDRTKTRFKLFCRRADTSFATRLICYRRHDGLEDGVSPTMYRPVVPHVRWGSAHAYPQPCCSCNTTTTLLSAIELILCFPRWFEIACYICIRTNPKF